ncbi:MAG: nucleotidyltransferase domain-containing protein [Deltaproteobacteria bacterium]|nr:nucleotidyltransferase domain-containing protein [Deltaproteobacteria bacterium]
MFVLDAVKFREAIRTKYRSIEKLAKTLGIHRNTIHYYLSGHRVLPAALEKMLESLELKPSEVLTEKKKEDSQSFQKIAAVVDQLHQEFPTITFVLFGSRTQKRAHRYSDWDIGAFSKKGLPHPIYRKLLRRKDELVESLPVMIDLINLNRAPITFLQEISKNWLFLSGNQLDWLELQRSISQ